MSGNIARIFFVGLASLALAGCASLSGILSSSEPAPVEAVAVEQVDDRQWCRPVELSQKYSAHL